MQKSLTLLPLEKKLQGFKAKRVNVIYEKNHNEIFCHLYKASGSLKS